MNMNMLNQNAREVYLNKCHTSFEVVLVDIDNIIENAAHNTYEKYEDKILNSIEDIKQNISIRIWVDFTSIPFTFVDEQEVRDYILQTAEEVLQETRG